MNCPYCRADNPDTNPNCSWCGKPLSPFSELETFLPGPGSSPPPAQRQSTSSSDAPTYVPRTPLPKKGAVAAATPPPGGGAGAAPAPLVFGDHPTPDFGERYEVLDVLGEGGMGTVYKAYDRELDRLVALKLIRRDLTADPGATQRFKQELLLASKISHKNVLRIHDLGEAGGNRFISMAYVEGPDLHHLLEKEGKLSVERALAITKQLCSALDAAHSEGVVHRDFKPQNILVDANETVYVSDFGLAKSFGAASLGMTKTGQFVGTPRYMSPEQAEARDVDHRTDIYALGLILCEMVTGDIPFAPTDSALQMMFQRVREKPKDPKTLNPDLPDYLVRVIQKCLEQDLNQRYASAKDILTDLETGRPPARSTSSSVQLTLPVAPKRLGIIAAAAIVLLLGGLFAVPSLRHRILGTTATTARPDLPPLSEGKFVAVLPFRVLGDPASLKYVSDGLGEALTAKLFSVKDLHVSAASSVENVKDVDAPEKAAREVGANLVVYGTVQGAGDKIRVVVNLMDATSKKKMWTQEFSGVSQDLLTIEDQIYAKLTDALQLGLKQEDVARANAHPTENIDAYDLYLRGRNVVRTEQDAGLEKAIQLYTDALNKDPQFALAYAGLADASLFMYRKTKDSLWSEKALGAAQRAQRLNDQLPEVHFALGRVYLKTGKAAEALAEIKRALTLAPNSDDGYRRLAEAYIAANRTKEAIDAYRKAIEINPYNWLNHNELGTAYLQIGDNDQALKAFQHVTEMEPDSPVGYRNMGVVYYRQGKWQECIPTYQKALQLQPHFATYSNLGVAYFYLKRYDEAAKMFEKAVEMNPNEQIAVGNLADAYRQAGQKDKAAATYEKAIALGYKELQVNPRNASTLDTLSLYYAKKGDSGKAIEFIRRARSINPSAVDMMYDEAVVMTLGGKRADALDALRNAFAKGYSVDEAKNDPELKDLQNLPEFQKMVSRPAGK